MDTNRSFLLMGKITIDWPIDNRMPDTQEDNPWFMLFVDTCSIDLLISKTKTSK